MNKTQSNKTVLQSAVTELTTALDNITEALIPYDPIVKAINNDGGAASINICARLRLARAILRHLESTEDTG